jgi:hypothetical protein
VYLVHTDMALLIPAFSLLLAPPVLPIWLLCLQNAPLPTHLLAETDFTASVQDLSLDTLSVPLHSTSELLRTLSMMAASKPTSWLFGRTDSLVHSVLIWRP